MNAEALEDIRELGITPADCIPEPNNRLTIVVDPEMERRLPGEEDLPWLPGDEEDERSHAREELLSLRRIHQYGVDELA